MPKFSRNVRRVPARALRFEAALDPVAMPEATPAADPAAPPAAPSGEMANVPVRLVARTGNPVSHWLWGNPVIHDFAGMKSPAKIPIDYCHNSADVIGFADSIDSSSGSLVLSGMLTPLATGDRADEVIRKAARGVPYQASIHMGDETVSVEEVAAGSEALVNGQTVQGPITIFRQWSLRGVAICPQGVDPETSVGFSEGEDPAETEVTVYAEEPPTEPTPTGEMKLARTGPEYLRQFGDVGGRWFAEGVAWDDAQRRFAALQTERANRAEKELADLKKTVETLRGGTPVSFSAPTDKPEIPANLRFALPDPLAKFAAANAASRDAA